MGIAVSTVLNSFANTGILVAILIRRGFRPDLSGLFSTALRALLAAGVMAAAVRALHGWLGAVGCPLLLSVPLAVAVGGALYLPLAGWFVPQALREVLDDLPLRRRRARAH